MFGRTVPGALRAVKGRMLATARTDEGAWVGATPTHLVVAPEDGAAELVPWHEVLAGAWDRGAQRLAVQMTGGRSQAFVFAEDPAQLVQTFHERVGASVVLSRTLAVPGGKVRVAIRKDMQTRELFDVAHPEPGVDLADPAVARIVGAARAELRDQVGLPL